MKDFIISLSPVDGRKSFYGKAVALKSTDGTWWCRSYNTIVCSVDKNGTFHRHWDGYSATTMQHINAFIRFCGIEGGGKAWWDNQEVTKPVFED